MSVPARVAHAELRSALFDAIHMLDEAHGYLSCDVRPSAEDISRRLLVVARAGRSALALDDGRSP